MTFYHAVMRPIWSDLEHTRDAGRLWQRSQRRLVGNVLGPHFEHVARHWTRHMARSDLFGDHISLVASGTVNDPGQKSAHQVDVIAFGLDDVDRHRLLAIGEAKWGETMGIAHLNRLRHIRALLTAQGRPGAAGLRLACYSGNGFTVDLRQAAGQDESIVLVDIGDLYQEA